MEYLQSKQQKTPRRPPSRRPSTAAADISRQGQARHRSHVVWSLQEREAALWRARYWPYTYLALLGLVDVHNFVEGPIRDNSNETLSYKQHQHSVDEELLDSVGKNETPFPPQNARKPIVHKSKTSIILHPT